MCVWGEGTLEIIISSPYDKTDSALPVGGVGVGQCYDWMRRN